MGFVRMLSTTLVAAVGVAVVAGGALSWRTESDIDAQRRAVERVAAARLRPVRVPEGAELAGLPLPVQRWVHQAFPAPPAAAGVVSVQMRGQFRRPGSDAFHATTARLTVAIATPAMLFDATTPVVPGVWARAYDAYVDGRMTMRAKLLSAFTVVDEASSPALDRMSLRRWLIEASLYPIALLPGGHVRWEPVDAWHARAVVQLGDLQAPLVATFADDGRLIRFDAETPGDPALPYHGSGERVERSDERLVQGVMIPHRFVFSRVTRAGVQPFWDGEVTQIRFD